MAAPVLFEVLVFEHYSGYDGADAETPEEAVAAFVAMCSRHVDPRHVPQASADFGASRLYMSYADMSGICDKPKLVLLMGYITEQMVSEAKAALAAMYTKKCEHELEEEEGAGKGEGGVRLCQTLLPLEDPFVHCKPCREAESRW